MEQIKEAFSKVKQDMDLLKDEISDLKIQLEETRKSLVEVCEILIDHTKKEETYKDTLSTPSSANNSKNPADNSQVPAYPADNSPQKVLNTLNLGISTGNRGVPTDRQTDQQTDQQMYNSSYNPKIILKEDSIKDAIKILGSLDNLKKEIRLKFKRLTDQEVLVFSTIYQQSEGEEGFTDYKNLSQKLNLTESSIRDYVGRLISKGIPIDKKKINNKTIHLSISENLKRIASLATILQLREI